MVSSLSPEEVGGLSDQGFADLLRSTPREIPPEELVRIQRDHDADRGPYIPHEAHHSTGQAGH